MKKYILYVLPVLTLFASTGCHKEESPTMAEVKKVLTGTWHISLFAIDGTTYYDFTGYDFVFSSNGMVKAKRTGANEVNGTWGLWKLDGKTQLDLNMGANGVFTQLDIYWEVTNASQYLIHTQNKANGYISHLTFERN